MRNETECLVIGAGPAGLSAAISAANAGVQVLVVDENSRPGGQLFKQIHKFFGSEEHRAGQRGFRIGEELLEKAQKAGVEVLLNTRCWGLFENGEAGLVCGGRTWKVAAKRVIVAVGACENALAFPGCTLPGVMTAGAVQTMVNLQRVLPGHNVVMVGTGNVGLIVGYQLMQAGARLAAVVEASTNVGGYQVHAAKLRRAGVPFYLGHTVARAYGDGAVQGVEIAPVDGQFRPVLERAFSLPADTVALAVGLHPRVELCRMAGAQLLYNGVLGGHLPKHNTNMKMTPECFVAGDAAGVEEASTAMEEGSLAGLAAAIELGCLEAAAGEEQCQTVRARLEKLRSGQFGEKRQVAKQLVCEGGLCYNE